MATKLSPYLKVKRELETEEKKLNIERLKQDIEYDKNETLVSKAHILGHILELRIIDSEKAYVSDTVYKSVFNDDEEIEIIKRKLMELIKKF